MTTERVSKLHIVETASAALPPDSYLTLIEKFIDENLIDLEGDYEADIELEQPTSDERRLGVLTVFERKAFILGALVEQRVHDLMVELEAITVEKAADVIRKDKTSFYGALHTLGGQLDDDNRANLTRHILTGQNLATAYEWSVRQRFGEWNMRLVVRNGFVVYCYG